MRTTAIIVAAGSGRRVGGGIPKQFQALAGRPLLAHTLDCFVRSGVVNDMILVLPEAGDLDRYLGGAAAWSLPVWVVSGGAERQDSVAAGLQAAAGSDLVLVHDGVRPLVSSSLIRAIAEAAQVVGAAVPVLPCTDTVKEVREGRVRTTLDRAALTLAQTPQGFQTSILCRAHAAAREAGIRGTDDAALVERLGLPVAAVPGSPINLKVTTPRDLRLAAWLLEEADG